MIITGERGELGSYLLSRLESSSGKPSRIIHLAGKLPAKGNVEEIIDGNINYLMKTIKMAEEKGVEEFVFFSTNSIYKGQDKEGIAEETVPLAPDIYTLTKYLGEEILRKSNFKRVLCIRIGGLLEVSKSTNFLSQTLGKLLRNEPVTVTNADRFYNNFASREDVLQFVSGLTLSDPFDIVHLGPEADTTLGEIINVMKMQSRSDSPVVLSDEKTPFFNLNIEKAKKKYGFRPKATRETLEDWVAEVRSKPATKPA